MMKSKEAVGIQCYGCQKIFEHKDLAYECMCLHDEYPTRRGICTNCAATNNSIQVPEGHNIQKIHKYSEKSAQFYQMIEKEYPMWGGLYGTGSDEHLLVSYRETPEGARDKESIQACMKAGVQCVRKIIEFPDVRLSDLRCTCCPAK